MVVTTAKVVPVCGKGRTKGEAGKGEEAKRAKRTVEWVETNG